MTFTCVCEGLKRNRDSGGVFGDGKSGKSGKRSSKAGNRNRQRKLKLPISEVSENVDSTRHSHVRSRRTSHNIPNKADESFHVPYNISDGRGLRAADGKGGKGTGDHDDDDANGNIGDCIATSFVWTHSMSFHIPLQRLPTPSMTLVTSLPM